MNETISQEEEKASSTPGGVDSKAKPSRVWTVLSWTAVIMLIFVWGGIVAMLLAGGMQKITGWYFMQFIPPIFGLIFLLVGIVRTIVTRHLGRSGLLMGALFILSILPAGMMIYPLTFPASLKDTNPSATVRLPANVPLKVAWGGDKRSVNNHVITPDQRWAYDFVVEPYFNGSANLSDYGCYGVTVVAPISGQVIEAHDGEPDATPGVLSNNMTAPAGNHVIILLETGTYLEIAHLKPGSVVVRTGDWVQEGQVIGQCGNSGNTSEPHIHIHHQRQNPLEYPINFAEGLPLYFRDLDGPPMPEGGIKVIDGKPVATGMTVQHTGE